MTHLIEKSGDIFTTYADCIGHGVNVYGVMGGGIGCFVWQQESIRNPVSPLRIYNIASQCTPGRDARLEWLTAGVKSAVADVAAVGRRRIALPQIGCGIGGLEWPDVLEVITDIATSGPVDIEAWTFAPAVST